MRGGNNPVAPESRTQPAGAEIEAAQKASAGHQSGRTRGMFDMTCEELRLYFEDHLRDAEAPSDRGAVTEQTAVFADWSLFVAEPSELGKNLCLVRESAPRLSESVDASVVRSYRRHMAQEWDHSLRVDMHRFHAGPALAWTAIAAAALVGVSFWVFSARKSVTTTEPATAHHATAVPTAQVVIPDPVRPVETTKHSHAVRLRTFSSGLPQGRPDGRPSLMATRDASSLPDGFRSLMYCDELSCSGEMDMIRVQLPFSAIPRQASGYIQPVRSVTADVLVGPDGIARGMRFEEI